ncbi:aspartate/glutamate racemase family protein [Metabacillus bambusae]|uniref:aspartate/glutamate racemase family protein n=1 Tax=Metabacillus bambusae TaxID=2795218 RepID=UPI001FB0C98E|nr:aspartate/glutamate racemase family protein [Metabacillus bambusae]
MEKLSYRIGLIHATMNSVQPIISEFKTHAPEVKLLNFMDEGLLDELNETGIITSKMIMRLSNLAARAEESKVDAILFTCSSFSPYIAKIGELFDIPVMSSDQSMLEQAVNMAQKIGVIATVEAAGPTTTKLLKRYAEEANKEISIQTTVVSEAFQALQNGDINKHDAIIKKEIANLSDDNEVILLAQFSIARVLDSLKERKVPILTSPETSVKAILNLLKQTK